MGGKAGRSSWDRQGLRRKTGVGLKLGACSLIVAHAKTWSKGERVGWWREEQVDEQVDSGMRRTGGEGRIEVSGLDILETEVKGLEGEKCS